jgi:hypothetical protein
MQSAGVTLNITDEIVSLKSRTSRVGGRMASKPPRLLTRCLPNPSQNWL